MTVLSVAGYIAPFFVVFPLAAAIQVFALGVLTAVSYGIINDHLACRQCIHYFTIEHTPMHKRLLATDNPTLNGIGYLVMPISGVAMLVGAIAVKILLTIL